MAREKRVPKIMVQEKWYDFDKRASFSCNVLLALIGIVMVIAGAIVYSNIADYHAFIDADLYPIFLKIYPMLLIIAGIVLLFVTGFGSYATYKENSNFLLLSIIASIGIFVLEIVIIWATTVKKFNLEENIDRKLHIMFGNVVDQKTYFQFWRSLQSDLQCCGIYGPWDWRRRGFSLIPYSCCPALSYYNTCTDYNAYPIGCKTTLLDTLSGNSIVVISVAAVAAIFHILGIVFFYRLYSTYRKAA